MNAYFKVGPYVAIARGPIEHGDGIDPSCLAIIVEAGQFIVCRIVFSKSTRRISGDYFAYNASGKAAAVKCFAGRL